MGFFIIDMLNFRKKRIEEIIQDPLVVVIGALICTALWGSAFPCIKIGYRLFSIGNGETAEQILFAGMRFALAGALVILAMSILQRRFLVPAKKEDWKKVFLLCIFQTIFQYSTFYIGLANATGVSSSIIKGTNALVCVIVTCLIFQQEKLTLYKVIGCLVGFGGVLVMNIGDGAYRFHLAGEGLIVVSTVAYAVSSSLMHAYSKDMNPATLSGWQFLVGGLVLVCIGKGMGGSLAFDSAAAVWMLLYLAFLSAMAYTIWSILLKYNPVSRITVFSFMTSVFGVFLSAVLLRESIADKLGRVGIALFLTTIGIFIVQGRWKKQK